ncbi:hypothetical protein [Saccharibacillus sacchari]|uniref:hypothetical protein n=1 Tax=Saccharibacillus sacchari TaxID=456493 RepID=UPI0004B9A9C1|nr:hypothetical protein [Saccharibacillus sacchari]
MSEKRKMWIWLLIPFLYGALSFVLAWIIPPLVAQIVFGAFWLWVGMRFARLSGSSIKNFVWGNSLWLISFLLLIWQFVLVEDENRNMAIAAVSQNYMLSFVLSGAWIYRLFDTTVIQTTPIMILAYIVMFAVFAIGFVWGKIKKTTQVQHV